MESIPLVCTEQ